jgi:FkbM family methyltransferase
MNAAFKRGVKHAFDLMGFELWRKPASLTPSLARPNFAGALEQLSRLGFRPRTVVDVGVAFETRELYEAFPEANHLLIEPLVEFEPSLKKICSRYRAQYILAAAGEAAGISVLNVHTDQLDSSSLLAEVEGPSVDGAQRQVQVVTVDDVCFERGLTGPYLVKADVQGAELKVLAGASKTLHETEVVILEVNLFGTMFGGPQLFDVLTYMKERGFVAYDLWGFLYRPLDGALAQVDIAFVRENGRFRQTQAFATAEQRRAMKWAFPEEK